jgi:hypothetical protein
MMCWLLHFWNIETFHWKQENHAKFHVVMKRADAYKAYRQQCRALDIKPYALNSIAAQLKRLRKRMRNQSIRKLQKTLNTQTKTKTVTKKYQRHQSNYKIKSDIAGELNAHLASVAIYQAVALGSGMLSKLDRTRKAATMSPVKSTKIIPMEGDSDKKTERRKLHRLGPISGLRTDRTTCLRPLPAFSSHKLGNSVQRLIKHRIQDTCRAKYWTELAQEGIVGISPNAEDGNHTYTIGRKSCMRKLSWHNHYTSTSHNTYVTTYTQQ